MYKYYTRIIIIGTLLYIYYCAHNYLEKHLNCVIIVYSSLAFTLIGHILNFNIPIKINLGRIQS